tara:strand:- start:1119 stop:1904 length:786 start_codon:yes stop_codon:yes gene_type:complete
MRLAVCLFGNLGNALCAGARDPRVDLMKESVGFNDVSAPRSLLDKNLCSHYDTDFFLHSWSEPSKDFILELYNPKSYEITSQKHFDVDLEEYGLIGNDISEWKCSDSSKFGYEALLPSRGSVENILEEMPRLAFRSSSRYYSSQRSIELKRKYEEENNFTYDFVLVARFDNMFHKRIPLEQLKTNKFYGSFRYSRIDKDHAIHDQWFLGGSENMDKYGSLFDCRHDYCIRPTFSSRQHIQKNIGDENLENLFNETDYGVKR